MQETSTTFLLTKKSRKITNTDKIKGWTPEEDKILLDKIRDYPDNISEAIRQAVPLLKNRTIPSTTVHYYDCLRKKNDVITVGSKQGFSKGNVKVRKNKSVGQSIPMKPQLQHLHKMLIEIMQMSDEEKEKIKTFVNTIL